MATALNIPLAPQSREVVAPANRGLYLDRPAVMIPPGGLSACLNIRVKNGRVVSGQLGYERFLTSPANNDPALNGMVILIDQFFLRDGSQMVIFGTKLDLYYYHEGSGKALFITPYYNTGTVISAVYAAGPDETTITGSGTAWDTAPLIERGGTNKNVRAGDFYYCGSSTQNDPTVAWFEVDRVNSDTELIVKGDASGVTGNYTIRQLFSGDDNDVWSSDTFPDAQPQDEDTWYAVNAFEWVKWTATAASAGNPVERMAPGFRARILAYYRNMMLAGNITVAGEKLPGSFRSSVIAYPEDFTTGEAAELKATKGLDELLAFFGFGDIIVAYCDRSINVLEFVDLPLVWAIRTAVPGIGPISDRGIMDYGDYHEFIASDSQYRFDGLAIREIGTHVFREVLRTIDPNRRFQVLAHIDEENGDVIWIVPLTTDSGNGPEKAYQVHYLEEVSKGPEPITVRQLPATATGFYERVSTVRWSDISEIWQNVNYRWNDRFFQAAFPLNLFGDENGNVFTMNTVEDFDGEDIVSYARFHRFAGHDGLRKGVIKRIEPLTQDRPAATYDLSVRLYRADRVEGARTLVSAQDFDLTGSGKRWVNPRQSGLFFELEFGTDQKNQPWETAGYAVQRQACGIR